MEWTQKWDDCKHNLIHLPSGFQSKLFCLKFCDAKFKLSFPRVIFLSHIKHFYHYCGEEFLINQRKQVNKYRCFPYFDAAWFICQNVTSKSKLKKKKNPLPFFFHSSTIKDSSKEKKARIRASFIFFFKLSAKEIVIFFDLKKVETNLLKPCYWLWQQSHNEQDNVILPYQRPSFD